jgi:hypothetical protein
MIMNFHTNITSATVESSRWSYDPTRATVAQKFQPIRRATLKFVLLVIYVFILRKTEKVNTWVRLNINGFFIVQSSASDPWDNSRLCVCALYE